MGQISWLTWQPLPIIPVIRIVPIALMSCLWGFIPLTARHRSPMHRPSSNRRSLRYLPWVGCLAAVMSTFLSASSGSAQSQPQFPAPQSNASNATAAPEAKIESYPLNDVSRAVLASWQQYAAGRTDLRVAIDERTSQALVFAPPAVHAQIRQQLAQRTNAAPATGNPPPSHAETLAGPASVQLRHLRAVELHPRLERLLGRPLPATPDASGKWQSFAVEASPGMRITLSVHAESGQVRLDGPPSQVAAWRSVVEALDAPATDGSVTQLITTKPASHDRVRRTLEVLRAGGDGSRTATGSLVGALLQPQQDTDADADAQQEGAAQPGAAGQPPPGGEATQVAPGSPQTAIDAARLAEAAGGLLGPVDVEFVEGLDVIVLRGSERDVQRVMEIIRQIEELSAITVPAIQVYNLQHLSSMQIGVLLNRLYDPAGVLGARLGTVSITPLGKPNALLLIGRAENVQMAIELVQQLDQPVVPTARFEVFPLQHASAAEAKALLDLYLRQDEEGEPEQDEEEGPITEIDNLPPLAPRAMVVADIRTNFLIVVAAPRDMVEIAALIGRIDQPGATAQLKVFEIRNGDANTLVTTLRTLFSVPAEAEAATPGGLSQGGVVRLQFAVDPRTNSIIAAGSAEDLTVVEAILLRLDQGDIRERITTVHRLNNAFAQFLAEALNTWLQTQRQAEAEAQLAISPFEQFEREVIIVPEAATNSLIVSATPRIYDEIVRVIRELDERPPMVMIQVLIAEVRLNDTDEFGIELGLQDSLLFDRSLLSDVQTLTTTTTNQVSGTAVTVEQQNIINAAGVPGFNFNNLPLGNNLSTAALATAANVATQGLSNFSLNRTNSDLGFGGFVFSASSNSVNILLRALQESRRLEVLSRPQLMALDGQPGQVQVGQNVPRILGVNVDALGGTTNTIQYEPVGLILQVVPRISPDGLVVLQIIANKSEVGPEAEGIPISVSPTGQVLRAPRIEITQAQTTISALSGQTVVLGGLLQTRKFDVHRRVPLLADIPLLGDLFRYDSVAEERRELLIILTPRIIYGKEDADLVKQIESSRMSWILGDVINLHGEVGLRSRCDEWQDADIEAVFPAHIPEEGLLPLSEHQFIPFEGAVWGAPGCEPGMLPVPETLPAPATDPTVGPTPGVIPLPAVDPPEEEPALLPSPPLPPATGFHEGGGQSLDRYGLEAAAVQQASGGATTAPLLLPETDE